MEIIRNIIQYWTQLWIDNIVKKIFDLQTKHVPFFLEEKKFLSNQKCGSIVFLWLFLFWLHWLKEHRSNLAVMQRPKLIHQFQLFHKPTPVHPMEALATGKLTIWEKLKQTTKTEVFKELRGFRSIRMKYRKSLK